MAGYLNFGFEFHCFLLQIAVYGSLVEVEFLVVGQKMYLREKYNLANENLGQFFKFDF